jgi:tetratricopeptide (TPR) repeat protein
MKFAAMGLALGVLSATLFTSGCSRNRQEAVLLANKGDQIVDLDPNGAIQQYEQATQLDPSNHRILYKLAKAYKKKEEWDKVASTLARATDVAPSFANYWFERGWALIKQAEKGTISYEECKEPFKKCVEADPNKDECYAQLGIAMLYSDDEQKALANFTKAIEHRPDEIGYYTRLADLYARLGYEKEAEQVLNAAKEMANPAKDKQELYNVHTLLAGIYRDRKEIDKMVAEFEAAKSVSGEDPGLLFNLGMAYSKLNPPKKAESVQMLKGFTTRACKGKNANMYKAQCEQATTTMQRLKGPGS